MNCIVFQSESWQLKFEDAYHSCYILFRKALFERNLKGDFTIAGVRPFQRLSTTRFAEAHSAARGQRGEVLATNSKAAATARGCSCQASTH